MEFHVICIPKMWLHHFNLKYVAKLDLFLDDVAINRVRLSNLLAAIKALVRFPGWSDTVIVGID